MVEVLNQSREMNSIKYFEAFCDFRGELLKSLELRMRFSQDPIATLCEHNSASSRLIADLEPKRREAAFQTLLSALGDDLSIAEPDDEFLNGILQAQSCMDGCHGGGASVVTVNSMANVNAVINVNVAAAAAAVAIVVVAVLSQNQEDEDEEVAQALQRALKDYN